MNNSSMSLKTVNARRVNCVQSVGLQAHNKQLISNVSSDRDASTVINGPLDLGTRNIADCNTSGGAVKIHPGHIITNNQLQGIEIKSASAPGIVTSVNSPHMSVINTCDADASLQQQLAEYTLNSTAGRNADNNSHIYFSSSHGAPLQNVSVVPTLIQHYPQQHTVSTVATNNTLAEVNSVHQTNMSTGVVNTSSLNHSGNTTTVNAQHPVELISNNHMMQPVIYVSSAAVPIFSSSKTNPTSVISVMSGGTTTQNYNTVSSISPQTRIHKCSPCNLAFTDKTMYQQHLNSHINQYDSTTTSSGSITSSSSTASMNYSKNATKDCNSQVMPVMVVHDSGKIKTYETSVVEQYPAISNNVTTSRANYQTMTNYATPSKLSTQNCMKTDETHRENIYYQTNVDIQQQCDGQLRHQHNGAIHPSQLNNAHEHVQERVTQGTHISHATSVVSVQPSMQQCTSSMQQQEQHQLTKGVVMHQQPQQSFAQQQVTVTEQQCSTGSSSIVRPYKCDHCTASFIEQEECEEHRRKHSDDGPFTCEDCHFNFMYRSHFKSHKTRCEKKKAMMPHQPTNKQVLNLPVMKRVFPTHDSPQSGRGNLDRKRGGMTRMRNRTTPCQIKTEVKLETDEQQGGVSYVNNVTSSNNSVIYVANNNNAMEVSPRKFDNINRGTKRVVNPVNIRTSSAGEINTFNPNKPSFKRLKKQNNDMRPHECDQCDASFTTTDDLAVHKSKHSDDGPFKCDSCQFLYLYRKLYDAHKRKCKKSTNGPANGSVNDQDLVQQYTHPVTIEQGSTQISQQQQHHSTVVQKQQVINVHSDPQQQPQQQQQTQQIIYVNAGQHLHSTNSKPIGIASEALHQVDLSSLAAGSIIAIQPGTQQEQSCEQPTQQQQFQIIGPNGELQILDGNVLSLRGGQQVFTVGGGRGSASDVKYELVQATSDAHMMNLVKKGSS